MIWHSTPIDILKSELNCNEEIGLDSKTADERLKRYGYNIPIQHKKLSIGERIKKNLYTLPVILLIAAALIEIATIVFLSQSNLFDNTSILTPVLIIVLVLIDIFINIVSEIKTEEQIYKTKKSVIPVAKVLRNGEKTVISADKLVPGDIIILEDGDFIPADARLVESNSLRVDESGVTGVEVAVQKNTETTDNDILPLKNRRNMVYYGSLVINGTATAIVCETGSFTEYAKLQKLNEGEDTETVLERRLKKISNILNVCVILLSLLVFALGIVISDQRFFNRVTEIFPISVAIAAASVPQSLMMVVSVVLSLGINRMAVKKAIVHNSECIEKLGEVSVIIADKTGTLTKNELEVKSIYDGISLNHPAEKLSSNARQLLIMAALCSNSTVYSLDDGTKEISGDSTEAGIVSAAERYCKIEKSTLDTNCPRVYDIPFDSFRKLHTTINLINGKPIVISKGSADIVLEKCGLSDNTKILSKIKEMEKSAMRVLAVAIKRISAVPIDPVDSEIESHLQFVGLIGLKDKPVNELRGILSACRRGGINTVMITGDPLLSAKTSAEQLGIIYGDKLAIDGTQLAEISDDLLCENIERIAVYSRISPEDKLRIVRAWQKAGHVVAVTGDFHGDSEALSAADIGYALGKKGSDIAKEKADITLADDSFTTLATSVIYGRTTYNNIRRVLQFLIGTNLGEILTIIIGLILFKTSPLSVLPLLWMNFVTDSLPAIQLGIEPPAYDTLTRPPMGSYETVFGKKFLSLTGATGILVALLSILAYIIGQPSGCEKTMSFAVIVFSELIICLCMRSVHSIFDPRISKNPKLLLSLVAAIIPTVIILCVPAFNNAFGLTVMPLSNWIYTILLSIAPLPIFEIGKALVKKKVK